MIQLDFLVAFLVTLVITLLVMPGVIRYLHKIKFGQTEREEGLASHKVKNGTPTMGGIVFIVMGAAMLAAALFAALLGEALTLGLLLAVLLGGCLWIYLYSYLVFLGKMK